MDFLVDLIFECYNLRNTENYDIMDLLYEEVAMRILLAEDEKALTRALVKLFEKNNYSVDAVYNGEDFLTYLKTENYDACILDIMMPCMDGLSTLRKMRELGYTVPVLLLSAKSEIDDKVRGLLRL